MDLETTRTVVPREGLRKVAVVLALMAMCLGSISQTAAQDWPQWRGPDRDGIVSDFDAPGQWPAELTQKWRVTVGLGDSTPALVGAH